MSSAVGVHWFSEMRGSSCWAKTIKFPSQLENLRHLPVRLSVSGGQPIQQTCTWSQGQVKKTSERQLVRSAEESWNGEASMGQVSADNCFDKVDTGQDQIRSFMTHWGQLWVKRIRPYHKDWALLRCNQPLFYNLLICWLHSQLINWSMKHQSCETSLFTIMWDIFENMQPSEFGIFLEKLISYENSCRYILLMD